MIEVVVHPVYVRRVEDVALPTQAQAEDREQLLVGHAGLHNVYEATWVQDSQTKVFAGRWKFVYLHDAFAPSLAWAYPTSR